MLLTLSTLALLFAIPSIIIKYLYVGGRKRERERERERERGRERERELKVIL